LVEISPIGIYSSLYDIAVVQIEGLRVSSLLLKSSCQLSPSPRYAPHWLQRMAVCSSACPGCPSGLQDRPAGFAVQFVVEPLAFHQCWKIGSWNIPTRATVFVHLHTVQSFQS
jgi:hypothetical protein